MSPRAYLAVRPLAFGHTLSQAEGVAWMKAGLRRAAETADLPGADRAARVYDLLERKTLIDARVTALDDYTHRDWDRMRLHTPPIAGDGQAPAGPGAPWHQASLDRRMALFAETADDVAREALDDAEAPDVLVQVSCTGYDSPSAVQRAAAARGWTDARVLSLGHMGCYAALPALATTADVVAAEAGRGGAGTAAIVLVELCTLHHHPATTDPEQIVQQCLFADGAARLSVSARPEGAQFALLDHVEALVPHTLDEMTWRPGPVAFTMTLSRRVPDHIRANVGAVVEAFLGRHAMTLDDVDVLAVHPGGPRVIESTAEALGVGQDRVRHSQAVLRDRGNMSSTTLPHIWDRIARDRAVPSGARVLSLAFGPGLTVAGNLLEKV